MPSGTLMMKIHSQLANSISTPPITGPRPAATSATTAIVARPAAALARREDERRHREAERRDQAGADALQRAEADQPADLPRGRAQRRADREDRHAEDEEASCARTGRRAARRAISSTRRRCCRRSTTQETLCRSVSKSSSSSGTAMFMIDMVHQRHEPADHHHAEDLVLVRVEVLGRRVARSLRTASCGVQAAHRSSFASCSSSSSVPSSATDLSLSRGRLRAQRGVVAELRQRAAGGGERVALELGEHGGRLDGLGCGSRRARPRPRPRRGASGPRRCGRAAASSRSPTTTWVSIAVVK